MVLWASRFPLQHGCLGAFRTLGRAGVPVYAVVADPQAPVAKSRYVRGQILWQPQFGEGESELLGRLLEFGRRLGRRSLIVCTADQMAVLVARNRDLLQEWFVLPDVPAQLPSELVDKQTLQEVCRRIGKGALIPRSTRVDTRDQLEEFLDRADLPAILKSIALRGEVQSVENATLVRTPEALRELARAWVEPYRVLIQQYLPDGECVDWFTHGYCDTAGRVDVVSTGRKVRMWPVHGGSTAAAYTAANPELAALARSCCAAFGYRGVFDIDWRLHLPTGRYYLLDFNPRVGAQFRMFENDAGVDVVRALHLDLSGRAIPPGSQVDGERFIVEPWDLASLLARPRRSPLAEMGGVGRPRAAWIAGDDPRPVLAAAWSQVRRSVGERLPRRSAGQSGM